MVGIMYGVDYCHKCSMVANSVVVVLQVIWCLVNIVLVCMLSWTL